LISDFNLKNSYLNSGKIKDLENEILKKGSKIESPIFLERKLRINKVSLRGD
jgi:hypothetical protein